MSYVSLPIVKPHAHTHARANSTYTRGTQQSHERQGRVVEHEEVQIQYTATLVRGIPKTANPFPVVDPHLPELFKTLFSLSFACLIFLAFFSPANGKYVTTRVIETQKEITGHYELKRNHCTL